MIFTQKLAATSYTIALIEKIENEWNQKTENLWVEKNVLVKKKKTDNRVVFFIN